jgi:integrase
VRIADGENLYLQIAPPGGTKSWLFRYTLNGKAREMGLGAAGEPPDKVSLAKARQLAAEARALLRQGRDPIEARKAGRAADEKAQAEAAAHTFRAVAEVYIAAHEAGWRNAVHRQQWRNTLRDHVYPHFGDVPVVDVSTTRVMAALEPIWRTKPETASRLRGRIESVLDYAKARGWRDGENPARWRGHLVNMLPKRTKVRAVEHHPALPWREMAAFMVELRALSGTAARALEFLILTAARTGEVRGAQWSEIDFTTKVWTVPRERTKVGRQHRVPLSDAACAALSDMFPLGDGRAVFPGRDAGGQLGKHALACVIRRMNADREAVGLPRWHDAGGRDVVPHAFRSSFRDWCGETGKANDIAEAALAHTVGSATVAAYQRGDLLERRRVLVEQWAGYCAQSPAGVVANDIS